MAACGLRCARADRASPANLISPAESRSGCGVSTHTSQPPSAAGPAAKSSPRRGTSRPFLQTRGYHVKHARQGLIAICGAVACALAAAPAQAHDQTVSIRFAAVAGDEPAACGTPIEGLGTTSQAAQLADLRFFVSEVKLIRRDGKAIAVKLGKDSAYRVTQKGVGVTLIDLENGTGACAAEGTPGTNAVVRGTVPHGNYVGVRWTLGVPFALNHTDAPGSPAPLNSTAMGWSWQIGRKFTKIELTDPAGASGTWTSNTFYVHLGSAGCEGNPATGEAVSCTAPNRASVRMKKFDPKRQQIAVDLQALLAGNDVTVNRSGAPGCMSEATDPECAGVFGAFGIDWKADGTGTGKSPAGEGPDRVPRHLAMTVTRRLLSLLAIVGTALAVYAAAGGMTAGATAPPTYDWDLPKGFPTAARPRHQPDDRRQGDRRPPPVLRQAPLRQRHPVLLELPPTRTRVHRRPRAGRRLDRPGPPPQRAITGQRRLQLHAHLGQPLPGNARAPDGGPAVRPEPGRDGDHRRQPRPGPRAHQAATPGTANASPRRSPPRSSTGRRSSARSPPSSAASSPPTPATTATSAARASSPPPRPAA